MASSKNHFPDWLFYVASVALVAFVFLFFGGNEKRNFLEKENESLNQQLLALKDTTRNLDSTISETRKMKNQAIDDFNNLLERQGTMTIENYGEESSVLIDDFRVFYYDETVDSFKHFRGTLIPNEIKPKSTCAPKLVKDGKTIWNGQVLFYSLNAREYRPEEAGGVYQTMGPKMAYYFGTWENGKIVRINLDGFNYSDESNARKIVDYCQ